MNEQLKQLAVEAKLPGYVLEYGTELCLAPHLEKFAELIVRECASLTLDYKSETYYTGWLDYRDEIKKHFGVEE